MSEADRRSASRGRLLMVVAAILWSLGGVVAKALKPLDGVTIAFYRSLFAGLALLPFIARRKWTIHPGMVPIWLSFGTMVGLYLSSVTLTTAANAIFLQYSATFWTVPLAAILLRENPDRRSLIAIAFATVGLAAIVVLGRKGTPGEGLGIILGLTSGIGYATVIVAFRGLRDVDPAWLSASSNLGGAITLGLYTWATTGGIYVPTAGMALALAIFGVVQMAIPYLLFAKGLQTISAAEAAILTLLEPILGPIWVLLVFGEVPAPFTMIGGGILLVGVTIRYWPTKAE